MTNSANTRSDTPSAGSATTSAQRDLLIEAQKIRTHYRGMPAAFIGIAVVATIVAVAMPPPMNPFVMPLWVGSVYVLTITRFFLWRNYHRKNPPPQNAKPWGIYAIVAYGISGTIWGVGNIVLYPPGQIGYQLILLFVSLGAAMGALIGQISYIQTFYAFMYPLLILSAISFLRELDTVHITFSTLMFVYLAVGTRLAQNLHQAYLESVNLRFENLDLIENLNQQKASAEQARHIAEEANVSKSRFLAAASHDLRQPMHALGLFVQTLQDSDLPAAERSVLLNIRRSVDAMEELFNALLDVSKLDAGIITAHVATVPLAPILERMICQHHTLARNKGLRFSLRPTAIYVRTDPILLERILRNLVSNAVQHTRRGGILVGARRRGASTLIEVWDTGPGIPSDQQQDIFREFYQLRNPERDRSKGLGLGLAIVDRLSKLLAHPVKLRSTPGKGTVFSVLVPHGDAREHVPGAAPDASSGAFDFRAALVCFVDDELAVQEGMTSLMSKWSCDVIAAGSSAELLKKLAVTGRVPDLVISDYRLREEENGITVIEDVRNEFNAEIPAFLITGDTGPERLREAAASGLPILHKPLNPAKLRTLMANLLRNRPPG